MPTTINIAIAEDHEILAETLTDALNQNDKLQVVLQATNGRELIDKLETISVDVIILDLDMPVLDGRQALHIIRKKFSKDIKIIILSLHHHDWFIRKYLKAGANAYLAKGCDLSTLMEGIEEVHANGVYYHGNVTPELMDELDNDNSTIVKVIEGDALSKTEIRIMELLCQEMTCAEIAEKLFRSPRTIESHRLRIMKKINSKNAMGMMEYAIKHGIHNPR